MSINQTIAEFFKNSSRNSDRISAHKSRILPTLTIIKAIIYNYAQMFCYLGMPYWTECDTNFEATEPPSKPKIRHTLMNAVNATGKGRLSSEGIVISVRNYIYKMTVHKLGRLNFPTN